MPASRALTAAMVTSIFFLTAAAGEAASRGIPLKIRASEQPDAAVVEEVQLYGNSHALVIGIDDYTNGWPRLSMAVKDAKFVAKALEKKGFDVTLILNANSNELNRAFEEFFLLKGEDPDARLFVWYAGHGHSDRGEGFLVPADAPTPVKRGRFRLKSLALRRIGEFVRLAESKHAFAIFDSCFSGTVFESARALPPTAVTRATTLPVRQFLTSGDAGQTVSDDGTFRELFIRALTGEERADANDDGYLTASEMGLFLTDRVTNLTKSKQTPRYGKLRDKDWDRGDFVFSLPVAEKPKQVAAAAGTSGASTAAAKLQQETLFWDSIKDSGDPGAYKAYLEAFPNGTFAPLAKVKLNAAEKNAAARERSFEAEQKKLEEERKRLAAETKARRKAEDEARRKAFAEERAKLAAEREKFAAEAEARRKAEDAARRKAFAEEQSKLAAERDRLAKEQAALAAKEREGLAQERAALAAKEKQLAALTSPAATTTDITTTLDARPDFDGRPVWAGTEWKLVGETGEEGTLSFSNDGKKYTFDKVPYGSGFIQCEGDVDPKGNLSPVECDTTFNSEKTLKGTVFQLDFTSHGHVGSDVFHNRALEEKVLASLLSHPTGPKYLTADQIRALVSDNEMEFPGKRSNYVIVKFDADGDLLAENDRGFTDFGVWSVASDGAICLNFDNWNSAQGYCSLLTISGNTAQAYSEPGVTERKWKFKKIPEAFTKLVAERS